MVTSTTIRFSQFNASLNRNADGQLVTDLSTPNNAQAKAVAEIIQRVNPDVLLINEFDYVAANPLQPVQLLQQNYLGVSQNGATPINFPYAYIAPSNTGIASGFDLNNNGAAVTTVGAAGYGDDSFGFGNFPGQFGMLLLSKYEIDTANIRTFQNFLWKDMPNNLLTNDPTVDNPATPVNENLNGFYSPEEIAVLRLSSKSHWDVPVKINGETVHLLVSHPTPPTFDGTEDRNGKRNADEIRFWADYITPDKGGYIYDDKGKTGGLANGSSFVIMGDQNADPLDGDSFNNAILQLLQNPNINTNVIPSSLGAPQQSALQGGANNNHQGDPAFDTADFSDVSPGNLRTDYVLPSANLSITNAGVFWPLNTDPLFPLVGTFNASLPGGFPSSDHRLVYADVQVEANEFAVSPPIDDNPAPNTVAENALNGTLVGLTALAQDLDSTNNTVTYSLEDDAGGRFAINASSGVVSVADGTLLDFETQDSHEIVVKALSSDGSSNFEAFEIALLDSNDFIVGGAGNDVFYSGAQNDTVLGLGGDDILVGGAGNDSLSGGNGADLLYGEGGNDTLNGGTGNDYFYGGAGNDFLYLGNDTARDRIYYTSGDGQDRIFQFSRTYDQIIFSGIPNITVRAVSGATQFRNFTNGQVLVTIEGVTGFTSADVGAAKALTGAVFSFL